MSTWILLDIRYDLGFLPEIIRGDDPRPVKDQVNERYRHGGGWDPTPGFKLLPNFVLEYPEDPPYRPVAMTKIGAELVYVYPHDFVGVFQSDGSFEVARMD
jgi:hypothetical protein